MPNTPKSPTWRMADLLLGGRLAERISALRAEGNSFEEVARLLANEGVRVTSKTVSSWARQLGVDGDGKAA